MRRTINEKIKIIKQATSKKKILKLSIELGITTKTIKNWIRKYKNAEFESKKNEKDYFRTSKTGKQRPFRRFAYIVVKADDPLKNGNGGLYRHMFKDIGTGYIFCGYSKEKSRIASEYYYNTFLEHLKKERIIAEKIITNVIVEKKDGIAEKRQFAAIKSYSTFALKKISYIKEREKYDDCRDFLFDSLATVCRSNNNLKLTGKLLKKADKDIKKINYHFHSDIYGRDNCVLKTDLLREHLKTCYERAVEFHNKYDLVNADFIYEKLYYILKDTEIDTELLLLVLLQRNKIAGLKHNDHEIKKLTGECSRILSKNSFEKKDIYLKTFYYILMDQNRIKGVKNRAIFYMKKIEEVVSRMNDLRETGLFNLNAGRLYVNFKMFDKSLLYFGRAKSIIYKHEFKDIIPSLEESYADLYNKKGDYESSKKVYKEMIDSGIYSASPYYRGLLFAKYADQYHLTCDLQKAASLYDESLEIINKHIDVKVFRHLGSIIESNKAFTLFKMNDFDNSKAIYKKNLAVSKENDFKDQILTNLTYLIMVKNEISDIKGAEKNIKDLALLLKNINKPEIEYKYHLAKGELERNRGNYSVAEVEMKKAVEITQDKDFSNLSSYFEAALKLLDLYSLTKNLRSSEVIADQIIKKASKKNLENYIIKAKLLKQKCEYFSKNNHTGYHIHLKTALQNPLNDELKYFIENQYDKCQKWAKNFKKM